jgi:hypothetical protein
MICLLVSAYNRRLIPRWYIPRLANAKKTGHPQVPAEVSPMEFFKNA